MRRYDILIGATVVIALAAAAMETARPHPAPPPTGTVPIEIELVTDNLDAPLYLTAPADDERLFVIEKLGRIRIVEDGRLLDEAFLDVSAIVELGPEQGLLGLAFHPNYAENGRFFVYYTTEDEAYHSHIVEYRVSADDPNRADPDSAEMLLTIDRPTWRHNAGWIAFGPDGLLYAASGDGGGTSDPYGHGQNIDTLMGTVFRIDVDGPIEPEVIAWGLRNPWRVSFDGDHLWLGDVGQDTWEEIDDFDLAEVPVNFGWSVMEGPNCYLTETCEEAGLRPPAYAYTHDEGCSVTGGYVYRGDAIPGLRGHYVFADWCSGWVRSINTETGDLVDWTPVLGNLGAINSFGLDAEGELYVVVQQGRILVRGGAVYKIVRQ